MCQNKLLHQFLTLIFSCIILYSCNGTLAKKDKEIVYDPTEMDKRNGENIKAALEFAMQNNGKLDDSTKIIRINIVQNFYRETEYRPSWSKEEKWQPLADTLFDFIEKASLYGLFRNDYHFKNIHAIRLNMKLDSLLRMDASVWARADILLTDGFMHIVNDLKQGRLQPDSISLNKDTALVDNFFITQLKKLQEQKQFTSLVTSLQPKHNGYWELKNGIKRFIDSMDNRTYTYISYPYKKGDSKDSAFFIKTLQKRLFENNAIDFINKLPDSAQLNKAIQKYQVQKKIKPDGKISTALIRMMNISDAERFKRIAITLDRYKQMPEEMPEKYIWVNLPGFYLKLVDKDTIALESKIICGKPATRTPLLNSEITEIITYPTWTVPTSIIAQSYLPKLKNNPKYLSRLGLKLINSKGETIDPGTVNWSRYSKGIPYKVMQNSGDNNALGVIKFNFNNPFAVYLHDTNQRYLFKNSSRALSHGCVRVQEWEKLAFYIARNDSIHSVRKDSLKYTTDSIRNWIAHKERHRIDVKNHLPLYIRYFSCEGKDGKIIFYDDIYGEDKILRDKYFANK